MAAKILVIEDSATFRAIVTATFRQKGYEVVGAENGIAGIQTALSQKPDIIVLDLTLPDMSGIEVAATLKADLVARQIPIIVCTAYKDEELREKLLKTGAADILTKPVHAAELYAAVERNLPGAA